MREHVSLGLLDTSKIVDAAKAGEVAHDIKHVYKTKMEDGIRQHNYHYILSIVILSIDP